MIFSARRKPGKGAKPRVRRSVVLIESDDAVFAEKIGRTLDQWGVCHLQPGSEATLEGQEADVDLVLLDVRDLADDAFGRVYSSKEQYAGSEVVLINKPDNVVASIAGMKAGAVDEIIVPIETGTLQTIITDSCARVQAARVKKTKKPLLARFSEVMMAATFAQAGDFEGAMDMLDTPAARQIDKSATDKKNGGS